LNSNFKEKICLLKFFKGFFFVFKTLWRVPFFSGKFYCFLFNKKFENKNIHPRSLEGNLIKLVFSQNENEEHVYFWMSFFIQLPWTSHQKKAGLAFIFS